MRAKLQTVGILLLTLAGWAFIILAVSPIIGAVAWEVWHGLIWPRRIPQAEIEAIAADLIAQHVDRAEEMAFINEDRAWRYSDTQVAFKAGLCTTLLLRSLLLIQGAFVAVVRAIFQPITAGHQHAGELNNLLAEPWITSVILSSAFVNSNGVAEIAPALHLLGNRCKLFIGARNGSTTAQAIAGLLATGAKVYLVDTAMRARIFHPKLYLALGNGAARIVMGSANLTHAGLHNNIEAGANIELNLSDGTDASFVNSFVAGFNTLETAFPDHCFAIQSGRQIVTLMREGVLEDERRPTTTSALGAGRQGPNTSKPRINLPFKIPSTRTRRPKPPASVPGTAISVMPQYGALLWAKPNLPTSDLQLFTHGNNPGVVRLTQAGFKVNGKVINQASYFRNVVFHTLAWAVDPSDPGKEMANVGVSLVIAGVYVGDFDLHLSHKPAWASEQANYTTGLHWDDAVNHIRKPGLIGRTLRLFAPSLPSGRYVVEID